MLLQLSATSSLLRPNVLLSTPFSDTLNLSFSLSVRDQVSHQYETTGKVVFLVMINAYKIQVRKPDGKRLHGESRSRLKDNIQLYVRETGYEGV